MAARNKSLIIIVAVCAAVVASQSHRRARDNRDDQAPEIPTREIAPNVSPSADDDVERAFRAGTSNVQVSGQGVVERALSDDNDGSRHQRFILKLSSGRTLLIAHNIDLAPRIDSLREGDLVQFFGEYEWNDRGGVLHWTHHDPAGQHPPGWLKHNGRTYE